MTSPAVLVNPDFCFEMVSRKLTVLSGEIKDLGQKKLEKLSKKGESSNEYVWNRILFLLFLQYTVCIEYLNDILHLKVE